jgi:phage FluMu protein Com
MKKSKTSEDAWELQAQYKDQPHGWIQWKGTDVCMDVYCKCGEHFHIDADFAYHVKCPECKTVYFCNGHIELIELEVEPDHCVRTEER